MIPHRILIAAFGDAGHAFPAISLALALRERGHEVLLETWERWRRPAEERGLAFRAAEEYQTFPPPPPGAGPGPADAALAMEPLFAELEPELVVADVLTVAPVLAAELHGCRWATLVPHVYPVGEPWMPLFSLGAMPPRSALGRAGWRLARPLLEAGLRRGRRELNESRARLGLPPTRRLHGGISEELVLVATLPELEYPRQWPAGVEVCGPLGFELPHPDVELPPGEDPLLLIASSTAHDPRGRLIRNCLEALAAEPVRVVASTNGRLPAAAIAVPANARLYDWLSYTQLLTAADLVICHGGHGTICRALGAAVPLLISPALGDMAENGARVQWAGCGLTLPSRLRGGAAIRWCVRELLAEPRYRERARQIATANPAGRGPRRAVAAVEALLARRV
jgi:UDP:flavonoid glycosyltransferase YjiC (YdhE family)